MTFCGVREGGFATVLIRVGGRIIVGSGKNTIYGSEYKLQLEHLARYSGIEGVSSTYYQDSIRHRLEYSAHTSEYVNISSQCQDSGETMNANCLSLEPMYHKVKSFLTNKKRVVQGKVTENKSSLLRFTISD